jgi:hypothetical protein
MTQKGINEALILIDEALIFLLCQEQKRMEDRVWRKSRARSLQACEAPPREEDEFGTCPKCGEPLVIRATPAPPRESPKPIRDALIFLLDRFELQERRAIIESAGDRAVPLGAVIDELRGKYAAIVKSLEEVEC